MPTGILEVKLGRPLTMPQKRFSKLLEQVRRDCCRARNASITHWLLFRRQHPDWQPGGDYDPPPRKIKQRARNADPKQSSKYLRLVEQVEQETDERKLKRLRAKLEAYDKPKKAPSDPQYAPREFMSRELYGVATSVAPNLSGTIASACIQEVNARLKANVPYNHDGDARRNWQAILDSEVSLPTWRGGRIPCPRSGLRIVYTDDRCEARFPLLSKKSGYKVISPTVRLHASDLTAGNRRILKQLADGSRRYCDSQITERKGKWYLQIVYDVPANAVDLPKDRVLTLIPSQSDDKWPFVLTWVDDDRDKRWFVGKAKPLIAEYRRIQSRRRVLRYRYRDGLGSGHGKDRFYRTIRPMERSVNDMCSRFSKQVISDIVKFAISVGCGKIVYREPTMPVRDNSWFAKEDVPFNWTSFEARLKYSCVKSGLDYDKERIRMGEWRPQKPQKDAG